MGHLQWRTVSTTGAPTFARHPHLVRPVSRTAVKVNASIVNPHSILGVSATADVKDIKRAYRKLALQYHPDVCKSEDGHQRFMMLTQAYELLLGRAEGKTDPNHASATGWDFHDWYWNFRMQRSWEKQQRQAKAAAKAAAAATTSDPQTTEAGAEGHQAGGIDNDGEGFEPGCGRRAPPHGHAGYKAPEGRDNLRSQLAGLRHRAAVRAKRTTASSPPSPSAPAPPSPTPASASAASPAAASSGSWSAASGCSMDEDATHSGSVSSSAKWSWTWSWDDTLDHSSDDEQVPIAAATAAAEASTPTEQPVATAKAAAAGLHHQYTHVFKHEAGVGVGRMAVHDGHLGTVVVNHAVPFPAGLGKGTGAAGTGKGALAGLRHRAPAGPQQQLPNPHPHTQPHQHQHESAVMTVAAVAESADGHEVEEQAPEPFSNPFEKLPPHQRQGYAQGRRRFHADSGTREAVSHQLTGLRRKAAIKAQWSGADSGSDTGL